MLYRNKKKNDVNAGKWIGVGGKKEQGEDMETCMRREIREETGLVVGKLKEEGIIDFIYPHKEAEKITIYTSSDFHGDITECNEGTLAWIDKNKIPDLSLWEGDRIFLKRMLNHNPEKFHFIFEYDEHEDFYELQFCEDRPIEYLNTPEKREIFWKLLEYGNKQLNYKKDEE